MTFLHKLVYGEYYAPLFLQWLQNCRVITMTENVRKGNLYS
jgi:hypothetical protein